MNTLSQMKRLCTLGGAMILAVVAMVLLLTGASVMAAAPQTAAPQTAAQVAQPAGMQTAALSSPIPATTCTVSGTTRTCEVWAKPGTITMPTGVMVPIWGFTNDSSGAAQVPGPVLVANQGDTVEIVFHNELVHNAIPQTVSLSFPGQMIMPDLTGISTGEVVTYTFTASNPGTYLYEAGLTSNGARQVAMGLFGGLIVRPTLAGQAYDGAHSAFVTETLLIFNEVDPAFNNDPLGFAMEHFSPEYWLINGKAYPDTENVQVAAGDRLLLRLINAGVEHRSIGLLGLRQNIIGLDAEPLSANRTYTTVAASLAPGASVDALTSIPASAPGGTLYALYNTALQNHNSNWRLQPSNRLQAGGMMAFIEVSSPTVPGNSGPVVTSATAEPNTSTGSTDVILTFDLSATNGGTVVAAELFTNTVGAPGTGAALSVTSGPDVTVQTTLPSAWLLSLPSGYYNFYLRGQDNNGVWGAVGSAILNLDKHGPDTISLSILPDPTNGTRAVTLRGTADDHASGNAAVASATFSIDSGTPEAMVLNLVDEPIVEVSAQIPAAVLTGLPEGEHPITIVSVDALGNVGTPAMVTLNLDKTGPDTSGATLTPNALDLTGAVPIGTVRLDAQIVDPVSNGVQSNLATAEGFISTLGAPGTGFALFPADGLFNETNEDIYFQIPVANFLRLAQGDYPVWVRGRDAAGNWGTAISATMTIDRGTDDTEGPLVDTLRVRPNPTGGSATVTLEANASDPDLISDIAAAEWFADVDPGVGNGFPMNAADGFFDAKSEQVTTSINVSTWANNTNYRLYVRARDAAGNWGATQMIGLRVTGNAAVTILVDNFDTDLSLWSRLVGDVTLTPDAQLDPPMGTLAATEGMGMAAGLTGSAPAYVALDQPTGERSVDIGFLFHPNGTGMGGDEHDILLGFDHDLAIFGIQIEGSVEGYEASAWVLDNGIRSQTEWVDIPNEPVAIKLHWESGPDAVFALMVNDTETRPIVAPNTSTYRMRELRLGPSDNLYNELSGTEYFDAFTLNRYIFLYLPAMMVE